MSAGNIREEDIFGVISLFMLVTFLCSFLKIISLHTVKTPDFVSISEWGNKLSYSDSKEQNIFFVRKP